ncbi:uncharacterized protein BKA55DRAFT_537701 [Fusarium redolens]|uniref:Uncharacterized protein n=1 Tax=Fusarium redolens TaxID=48865 RepID=A0A9P9HDW2_FUSRE|nr:uncharacterized protein BKA55DRAFT_537701 [Fusarium redolens]KAH7255287.1 hypothetical protein BKA55DRAFT_537701 [Fusarium redolens]
MFIAINRHTLPSPTWSLNIIHPCVAVDDEFTLRTNCFLSSGRLSEPACFGRFDVTATKVSSLQVESLLEQRQIPRTEFNIVIYIYDNRGGAWPPISRTSSRAGSAATCCQLLGGHVQPHCTQLDLGGETACLKCLPSITLSRFMSLSMVSTSRYIAYLCFNHEVSAVPLEEVASNSESGAITNAVEP